MKNLIVLISIVFFVVSCGEKRETNVESGTRNQILHVANSEEPRELDPQLSTGSPESNIHYALYEGLTQKHPKTLKIGPAVAESWTLSNDNKTYTFKIRHTAKWSNGEKLTAYDFVYSWKRSLMPNFGSEWAYMKYYIKNAEQFNQGEIDDFSLVGVRALSSDTLLVELNYPTDFFLQLLDHPSYYPVHKATIEKHAPIDQPVSQWTRPENIVVNGPFVLTKWEINQVIETQKNTHYWDAENVKLNGVHFYPITDQQAEVRAFRSGQVHLTYSPDMAVEKIAEYKKNNPEVLRSVATYSTYFYEFNTTKPPFNDVKVRRAFSMAIDRNTLVEKVSKGGERATVNLIPPDEYGYTPKTLYSENIEHAKKLLAEAGYPNGKDFPTIELLYNTQDNHKKMALAIQQMLKVALNVDITLTNQEWKVYLNNKKNLDYDMARAGWIADYLDPSNFLEILYSKSGNNDTGWVNDAYDNIVHSLKMTADPEERKKLMEQANQILSEEMPVLPIYNYSDLNLVSTEVKGWYDNAMHFHPYNRVYLEKSSH